MWEEIGATAGRPSPTWGHQLTVDPPPVKDLTNVCIPTGALSRESLFVKHVFPINPLNIKRDLPRSTMNKSLFSEGFCICDVLKHPTAPRPLPPLRNNNQTAALRLLNQTRMVINFTLQGPLLLIGP